MLSLLQGIASSIRNNVNEVEICNDDDFLQHVPILSFSSCSVGFVRISPALLQPLSGLWALVMLFMQEDDTDFFLTENEVCVSLIRRLQGNE